MTTKFVHAPSDRCFIHYNFWWDQDQPSTDIGMVRDSCLQHRALPSDDFNDLFYLSMKISFKGFIGLLLSICKNWSGLFAFSFHYLVFVLYLFISPWYCFGIPCCFANTSITGLCRWGLSRHFHYAPEILAAFFWSLPALFNHVRI